MKNRVGPLLISLLIGLVTPVVASASTPTSIWQANEKQLPAVNRQADDALDLVLGGTRDAWEDEYGEPADDRDADDFAIGEIYEDISGYDTVIVFWDDDQALHIQLNARSSWTESRALSRAERFLPEDVDLDSRSDELDGGELIYLGESDLLSDAVSRSTYRDYEVGGSRGDLRVILVPSEDDAERFVTVDIAIGQGDEYAGGADVDDDPTPTPELKPTEEDDDDGGDVDADADEYLTAIRGEVDGRQAEIDRFFEILGTGENLTDADFEELTTILANWAALPVYDAPRGYDEIDDAYSELVTEFANVSVGIISYLLDPTDEASFESATASLTNVASLLTTLDTLLTAEGY